VVSYYLFDVPIRNPMMPASMMGPIVITPIVASFANALKNSCLLFAFIHSLNFGHNCREFYFSLSYSKL